MKRNRNRDNVSSGVDVILEDLSNHPSCHHGPALLFERSNKRFYACSACRDRKNCTFYMLEEDWLRKKKKLAQTTLEDLESPQHIDGEDLEKIKLSPEDSRSYCHTCVALFSMPDETKLHAGHDVERGISLNRIAYPSQILKPIQNNKKEAQFLFSQQTISTVVNALLQNGLRAVLCIGVPSVHECIQQDYLKKGMSSLLLDIDSRRHAFHTSTEFCHYNMFNNHFFNAKEGETTFEKFIAQNSGKGVCIIMDPPFGGRIEPLGHTLNEITKTHHRVNKLKDNIQAVLPTMMIYPYFMEPQMKNHMSELIMCDYQVTYKNHLDYSNKNSEKTGSPVRIFTNIPLSKIRLPVEDGYKYCKICMKWIGKWNKHCPKCVSCCSKDGKTYKHCDVCERCVKPSWEHCTKCNRCCLVQHMCGIVLKDQVCFQCKRLGHKKVDCPNNNSADLKRKTEQPNKKRKK